MAKDEDYRRLIHTTRWLRLRKGAITAHPICQMCEKEGLVTPAVEVHHIVPVETGLTLAEKEKLMYDPHNLLALCHACHVRVHTEMGRCGKAAAKKRNEEKAAAACRKLFGEEGGGFF